MKLSNKAYQAVIYCLFILLIATFAGCGIKPYNVRPNQEIVKEFFEQGLEPNNREVIDRLVPVNFIPHNPYAKDGREGLYGFAEKLASGEISRKTVRLFEDGNLVLLHSQYHTPKGKVVAFDLYRLLDGLIVEHWDAFQPDPGKTRSGRTMLDGPVEATDLDKTEANRALVKAFVTKVFLEGKLAEIDNYIDKTTYHQHNPFVGDGLEGLKKAIGEMRKKGMKIKYEKTHNILAQGNFVFTQSEGAIYVLNQKTPTAFYDLFRIKNGKIVEHWDVIKPIPKTMAHSNGMF